MTRAGPSALSLCADPFPWSPLVYPLPAMLLVIRPDTPAHDVVLSSTTLEKLVDLRAEELLCLEAIYADDFLRLSGGGFRLKAAPLELTVRCSPSYPCLPPVVELCVAAASISKLQLFELEARIRAVLGLDDLVPLDECEARVGGELCELAMDFAADVRGDDVVSMHDQACECSDCIPNYARELFLPLSLPAQLTQHHSRHRRHLLRCSLRFPSRLHTRLPRQAYSRQHRSGARECPTPSPRVHRSTFPHQALPAAPRASPAARSERRKRSTGQGSKGRRASEGRDRLSWNAATELAPIVRGGFVIPGKKNGLGEDVLVRCGSAWGRGMCVFCPIFAGVADVLAVEKHAATLPPIPTIASTTPTTRTRRSTLRLVARCFQA